ncbi:Tripartite motif-containing protein 71 AltName: Full=Lin-41 homolog [Fibrisoma limi BUZ 3]|uniref:WGS project CAIT00000000 data, contig 6 n=1 Tax=Fibrisoma limi BUZ 3 TaxID=1185876 RepID=I2GGM3_9BACT|nr:T9SS type A sorting domain-containing protein [Fibrisoma limi]CCH53048.1 Tripartite motif-containing protein 71 AltName: Full=Lin-41 homolog [Fibrisoma limi BUZ 3]
MQPTLPYRLRISARTLTLLCLTLLAALLPWSGQAQFCPNGTTVAGGNGIGSAPNQLSFPGGLFVDSSGNVYVVDTSNDRIQKWAPGASAGVTVAGGNGEGSAPNQLFSPYGVFVDMLGNVYVADASNNRIQRWAPGASVGVTVAGGNGEGSAPNQLNFPTGLFVDGSGNVYVADNFNHRIQKWGPGATSGTTVAGGNGLGSAPNQLLSPNGLFVDGAGNVYVADTGNDRIQKWAPGALSGTTVAGGNGAGSALNQLDFPTGVFVDVSGNVYVADYDNYRIQRWAPGAGTGVTVAGGNGQGSAPNQLNRPSGVFMDGAGNVYVSEQFNHRIQRFSPGTEVGITNQPPTSQSVCAGASVTASVSTSGTVSAYQWYKDGGVVSGQTSATLSLPTTTTASSGSYYVVVTSCNSVTSTAFNLTVQQPTVSISPSAPAICGGQTATLTASGADTYRWSTGQTSPAISVSATGTYSVTATTTAGCSATAAANLTVNPTPTVSLSSNGPLSCSQTSVSLTALPAGLGTYTFSGPGLSQSSDNNAASVSQPGTYSVTLTSPQGCSTTATTTVTGATALTITQPPASQTACVGTSVTFAVQAQGPQGLTYAWFKNSADAGQPVLATTPTYTVNVNEGGKAGRYIVRVSAEGCTSQQAEARLTVNQRPVAPPPTSTRRQLCPSEGPVELSQFVSRTNASYQLRYSTEQGQVLTGSQVVLAQAGSYAYQVSQVDPATGCESVPTRFTLTVNATTQLLSVPPAQSVCAGSDLTLTVQASGTALKYEWFRGSVATVNKLPDNPSKQTGTTTNSLKLIRVSQSETYLVRISGECGVVTSEPIAVTVQSCQARQGAAESPEVALQVVVLGNPVMGESVEVDVRGTQGQPLNLQVVDQRGRLVDGRQLNVARAVEVVRLQVGQAAGLYLLQVATPTQQQTVKILKR